MQPKRLTQMLIGKEGRVASEDVEEKHYRWDSIFRGMKDPVNSGSGEKFSEAGAQRNWRKL